MEDRTGLYILLALLGIAVVGVVGFALWNSGTAAGGGAVGSAAGECGSIDFQSMLDWCKNCPDSRTGYTYSGKFKKGQVVKLPGEPTPGSSYIATKYPCVSCSADTVFPNGYKLTGGCEVIICSDKAVLHEYGANYKFKVVVWYVKVKTLYDFNQNRFIDVKDKGIYTWIYDSVLQQGTVVG